MIEKNDRELTLDELDKVTAGYPGSYEERQQILPDLSSLQEKKVEEKKEEIPSIFITENERLINDLPYGELSEEELDNVIGGRLR